MPCTTVLVGRKASNDGSTMIARTDDGMFDVKKCVVMKPTKPTYTSSIGHLTVELPEGGMSYTACPSVDTANGIWAATGINEANVGMTATETITTNPRVLGADPLVKYEKAKSRREKDKVGGLGEEDFVVLTLPYVRSAREAALRVGALLEKYGTYECNGMAFNDENEIWWLETIGGHHWIARRVADEEVVIMPNRFGLDRFDFDDAYGEGRENLCSADLRDFAEKNHLDLSQDGVFSPRDAFGSRSDADRIYNNPRAWFMGRYLCPTKYKWEGENADYTPESFNIPWALVPDKKVTVEDVKYILSSHYQGTEFNPYSNVGEKKRGIYRTIGINRTGVTSVCQIRPDKPDAIKGLEWIAFGPTTFNTLVPVYTAVDHLPKYLTDVTLDASTDNLYWASRMVAALADASYETGIFHIETYQAGSMSEARALVNEYDRRFEESGDRKLLNEANEAICAMIRKTTTTALNGVLLEATKHMRDNYNRGDN